MAANQPKDPKKKSDKLFTVDTDKIQQMPSVTKLLNRKRLGLSKTSTIEVASPFEEPEPEAVSRSGISIAAEPSNVSLVLAPGRPDTVPEIQLEATKPSTLATSKFMGPPPPASAPDAVTTLPSVKKAKRRALGSNQPLMNWKEKDLKTGTDPVTKAVLKFVEKGAKSALFFAAQIQSQGILFQASAYTGDEARSALWQGLTFDPQLFADVWSQFLKQGYIELPVLGSVESNSRNLIRAALGAEAAETVILVRSGTETSCRGILVVFSAKNITEEVKALLPAMAGGLSKKAA